MSKSKEDISLVSSLRERTDSVEAQINFHKNKYTDIFDKVKELEDRVAKAVSILDNRL